MLFTNKSQGVTSFTFTEFQFWRDVEKKICIYWRMKKCMCVDCSGPIVHKTVPFQADKCGSQTERDANIAHTKLSIPTHVWSWWLDHQLWPDPPLLGGHGCWASILLLTVRKQIEIFLSDRLTKTLQPITWPRWKEKTQFTFSQNSTNHGHETLADLWAQVQANSLPLPGRYCFLFGFSFSFSFSFFLISLMILKASTPASKCEFISC